MFFLCRCSFGIHEYPRRDSAVTGEAVSHLVKESVSMNSSLNLSKPKKMGKLP